VFKASIALVLIAFGALAYGWLSNDDTILYASIGASILAGLFLLRATLADRKAGYAPEPKAPRPERPAREPRERKPKKGEAAPARQRRGSGRLDSDEPTRQMDVATDDDSDEEPLSSLRPQRGRRGRLPDAPAGAAWAEAEQGYDDTEFEEEDQGMGPPSYDADYGDEEYDDDYAAPAAQAQGAAADDFRSRLAAVLGSAGEEAPPPPPAPVPPRARRVTPVTPEIDEAPPVAPKRRGRRKPEPLIEPEPEYEDASEESEPEWVRIEDVPNIPKPAPTDEMIHYRPRRPAVAAAPEEDEPVEPEEPPAPRRRSTASEVRPVGAKRPPAPRSSGVTRVSPAEKTTRARAAKPQDPDAPPPRRGRPPRPKP
jgi:hypothetical protein